MSNSKSLSHHLITLVSLAALVLLAACGSAASSNLLSPQEERASAPGAPAMDMEMSAKSGEGYSGASVSLD
jgi:uncharacterized lipoprotein YajG